MWFKYESREEIKMSNDIEFITNGYKIPLCLAVKIDGVLVTYSRFGVDDCFEFTAWTKNIEKAKTVIEEIVNQIISERSDYRHCVSWRTKKLEVIDTDERYGYTTVRWMYYVRDSG